MPLPWFRSRKASAETPTLLDSVQPAEPDPEVAPTLVASPPAGDGTGAAPKRRRRGSRGGRGRKKRPAAADGTAAPPAQAPATVASDRAEGERAERATNADRPAAGERKGRDRTPRSSRRSAPRRAPLPKAKRELLVSVDPGEKRVAILEDGVVAEVYLERPEQHSIAGNIYLGTVDNVLPGMEAAFVEIGLEKNGFLYVDEIVGPELEGRRGARKIQDLIQRGQTILVQAVKDPMKTKGARLTTEISLPGRFVVFVPHGDGLGVSRRLDDDERNRLKAIVKQIAPPTGGVIVRTAAEGASAEDVERDLEFLCRLWETIETAAGKAQAPALIYQEAELPLRVTRDLFTGDFEGLLVDHDRTYKRIVGYLKKTSPHMVDRVTRYREREPLLEVYGVDEQIRSTLSRRVDLPSGGYLIFDYAEAFTVIDVNTGRFVGSRSKNSGPGRLEETITKNNLEAVKEVVRQLRLRDVGGIIVIDFIDMANPKNRQQVEEALRQELERDRTKTYVVEISPLGLVEMTRQNVTDGPREVMTRPCPTCGGDGIVVSDGTAAIEVERRLRRLVTPGSRAKAFKVELNAKVAALLVGPGAERLRELEEVTRRRFFFVGVPDAHLDHLRVLEQGTVEKLAPSGPAAVGEELELRLGEVGLYDPHAGVGKLGGVDGIGAAAARLVGKLDGVDVIVADAARLVGKRARVHVDAVMEGAVFASVADTVARGDLPITAEAEAERPTRARRVTKRDTPEPAELVVEGEASSETESEAREAGAPKPAARSRARTRTPKQAAAAEANTSAVEPVTDEAASKPPRRRAASAKVADGGETEQEAEVAPDAASEEAPAPRKRTRRGTRGGRNRKRKTPVGDSPADHRAPVDGQADGDMVPDGGQLDSGERDDASEARPQAPRVVIHMPAPDLGRSDTAAAPSPGRSPSRPRSRGGRGRTRGTAAASANGDGRAETTAEPDLATASAAQDISDRPEAETPAPSGDDWAYTPMSEWGAD